MKAVLVSVVAAAVLAGIPGALVVACESAGYGSWGFPYFVFVSLALAACAVVFFVAFCAENGKLVLQSALFGAVAFGLMSVTLREQFHARTSAFEKLATDAEPLIDAIRDYEAANGRPPARLEDLVPGQLERIPGTGMRAYPKFDYLCPPPPDAWALWELRVSCPLGIFDQDLFVYWNDEKYPKKMYDGWVQRVGGWAYVHE